MVPDKLHCCWAKETKAEPTKVAVSKDFNFTGLKFFLENEIDG
jgi:hypothetical protein